MLAYIYIYVFSIRLNCLVQLNAKIEIVYRSLISKFSTFSVECGINKCTINELSWINLPFTHAYYNIQTINQMVSFVISNHLLSHGLFPFLVSFSLFSRWVLYRCGVRGWVSAKNRCLFDVSIVENSFRLRLKGFCLLERMKEK